MEENGLFVFTTDSSKEYLEILPKSGDVLSRAYSNIASVSHLNRIQSSSYNPSLEENQVTFMVGSNTLICTDDQFFVIEDNYIPPEPPIPPPETEDEVDEAKEQYEIGNGHKIFLESYYKIKRNETPQNWNNLSLVFLLRSLF
jgi:hypothetical protein